VQLLAVGAAAPSWRLAATEVGAAWGRPGGRGQAAVCAPDEDTLTLAAEAARRALLASGLQTDIVDGLWWGTSRPPFAEGPSHAVLASAVGLSHRSGGALFAGSSHAGIEALFGAADAVGAGTVRVALVVVSDAIVPGLGTSWEPRAGAGAAALVLVSHGGAASLGARVTRTHPYLDRYRGDDETATRDLYDPRLFREEIFLPAMRELGEQLGTNDIDRWSLPDPDGRLGAALARQLDAGTPASASVYAALGDTGAAAALLGGVCALDAAGTVGSSAGAADARPASPSPPASRCRALPRWPTCSRVVDPRRTPRCSRPDVSSSPLARRSRWAYPLRARSSCAAPTRCSACSGPAASTAGRSTRPRRSTPTASAAAAPSSCSSRSPATAASTPSS